MAASKREKREPVVRRDMQTAQEPGRWARIFSDALSTFSASGMTRHCRHALITVILYSCTAFSAELKPFTTDGCSAFPDGTREKNDLWIQCCIRHDFAYWKGGSYEERQKADEMLEGCVAELGKTEISQVMHLGVRLGGSPFFPTWYRWGYGWPYLRGYKPLTPEEKGQITRQLHVLRDLLDEFIGQAATSEKE